MQDTDNKDKIAREIRSKIGEIKLEDFAKMVGVHKDQLSRYARGASIPRADIYRKIMEFGSGEDALMVRDGSKTYEVQKPGLKELLDHVKEIIESGNEKAIEALVANIGAFLEMIRISKKRDENKGGD